MLYVLTLVFAGSILPKKKAIYITFIGIFFYGTLVLLEALGMIKHRPVFVLTPDLYKSPYYFSTQVLLMAVVYYFLVTMVSDFSETLRQKRMELEKERKKALAGYRKAREAERVLEVRVKARTKELERLSVHQEEMIKERTEKLEKKIKELERFQRLVVGRELKMIELKKEMANLNKSFKKARKKKE